MLNICKFLLGALLGAACVLICFRYAFDRWGIAGIYYSITAIVGYVLLVLAAKYAVQIAENRRPKIVTRSIIEDDDDSEAENEERETEAENEERETEAENENKLENQSESEDNDQVEDENKIAE
jgi:hypothetical protein